MKLNELYVFSINGFPEEHESLDKEALLGLGRAAAWATQKALPKIKGFFPKIKNMFSTTGTSGKQTIKTVNKNNSGKNEKSFLSDFMKSPRGKEFIFSAAPGAIAGFATADDNASLGSRLGRAAVFGGLAGGAGLGVSKGLRMYNPKSFRNKKIFGHFDNVW